MPTGTACCCRGARQVKYLTIALYHPRIMKGGAQYVAKDLHDAARADPDVQATLLAAFDANVFPHHAKVGAAITALPDSDSEYLLAGQRFDDFYHTAHDPRRLKALRRFLLDHAPDIVHFHHSLWVGLEVIELVRQVLPRARILYTLHEYLPICHARGQLFRDHEGAICQDTAPDQCARCFPDLSADDFILRRRQFRRIFALVDRFIAPSEHLRRRYLDWGIAPERIVTIANGHSPRRPSGWAPAPGRDLSTFGFFGQYIDAKGIDVLLRAAVAVARRIEAAGQTGRRLEIRIHGGNKQHASPAYLDRIESILSDAPACLSVTETGSYSRENVFDLMCGVDWVVVPSVWPETFGLVVSEAWDARRPVIASRTGALGDRIANGRNGLTFAPGSVTGLAAILEDCIGNEPLWNRLSQGIADEIPVDTAWAAHKALARTV